MVASVDRAGREHGRFEVANTVPAIEAFVENLTQLQARATGEVQVVLEDAQGHGALLATRLVRAGLGVVTLAPALVAQRRRRATIHASKSDVEDAQLIAKVALVEPGQLRPGQLGPADREALADLPRVRRHLVTERTATLNLLHRELHRAYPSYRGMFRDPWSQAAQRVWVRFPTPAQLDGMRRRTLVRVLKGPTGRGLSGTAIERVWHEVGELRRHRMPPPGALARVIPLLLGRLAELDRQLAALEAEMAAGLPAEGRLLTTIPGVRTLTAATLLVAIKDVRRFASSDALARFAGVAPRTWRSASRGGLHRSKRGHRGVHSTLYLLALRRITQRGPERAYFQRKVAEGKSGRQALTCLMRQLCRVIYAVLRDGRPYQADYQPPSRPAVTAPQLAPLTL